MEPAEGHQRRPTNDSEEDDDDEEEEIVAVEGKRTKRGIEEIFVRYASGATRWMSLSLVVENEAVSMRILREFERSVAQTRSMKKEATSKKKKNAAPQEPVANPKAVETVDEVPEFSIDGVQEELRRNSELMSEIRRRLCLPVEQLQITRVSGDEGSHSSFRIAAPKTRGLLLKISTTSIALEMFRSESASLEHVRVRAQSVVGIPQVLLLGSLVTCKGAFLLMEDLDLQPCLTLEGQKLLRRKLAQFHAISSASGKFGWYCDTYCGSVRQPSGWGDTWPAFFSSQRLRPLLQAIERLGIPDWWELIVLAERILAKLDTLFDDIPPSALRPSLLHGNLNLDAGWSLCGDIVAFDDMVPMYGHSEMDLARLSQSPEFASEYSSDPPLPKTALRRALYLLYFGLQKVAVCPGGDLSAPLQSCFSLCQELIAALYPPPLSLFPFGADIPLNKLRAPADPSSPASNVVLLYHGSFAPVHVNHLSVMESARSVVEKRLGVNVLGGYFSATSDPVLKDKLGAVSIPLTRRLSCLALATCNTDWMVVTRRGLQRADVAPLIRQRIWQERGWRVRVIYVYGADNLRNVVKSGRFGHLVCCRRDGYDEEMRAVAAGLSDDQRTRVFLDYGWHGPPISSTVIRQLLSSGDLTAAGKMVPALAMEYIVSHVLPSKEWLSSGSALPGAEPAC